MIRFPHIRCEFWGWGGILRVWINKSSLMRGTPEQSPGERAGGWGGGGGIQKVER